MSVGSNVLFLDYMVVHESTWLCVSLFNSLYIIFQNMNEASSLLSATCNTFITTLEECVKIANAKFKPEMFQLSHPDPLVSPVSPSPVQMVGTS